ncbi:MAG: 4Fe-4S cluster-binding domain-containing protein [Actinobacteria bacterium]|nr:4Fe-4S cluster-binding domain-containing protein [Actinomycetota bacterium]
MEVSKRILFYRISDDSILMINTLTGAMDIITSQIYHSLLEYNPSGYIQIDEVTLNRLKKRGYLIDKASEVKLLQTIDAMYAKAEKRLSFVICPTYSCNLRCTYCFEGGLTHDNRLYMDSKDVVRVFAAIDKLRQVYNKRKSSVDLFGGEPMLPRNKGFVSELLREARGRSLPVSIVTNGIHIEQFTGLLSAYKDQIKLVQITLDGPKDVHDKRRKFANNKGTFGKVCSSISTLLELQIKVVVRVNVDLQNVDSIDQLFNHMVTSGWVGNPYFTCDLSPVQDHALKGTYKFILPEDMLIERIFESLKRIPDSSNVLQLNMFRTLRHIKSVLSNSRSVQPLLYYCEANNLENMVFGPDGYIYACTECMGNEELAIGKFRPRLKMHDEAVKMWDGRSILTVNKCRECDIALLCGGGCAYSALTVNGDINEPVCNRTRETIFAYLDYVRDDLIKKTYA